MCDATAVERLTPVDSIKIILLSSINETVSSLTITITLHTSISSFPPINLHFPHAIHNISACVGVLRVLMYVRGEEKAGVGSKEAEGKARGQAQGTRGIPKILSTVLRLKKARN